MRYYICHICGNLIETIEDSGNTPSCCGKTMTEIKCGTTDGALEKHVPVCCTENIKTDSDKEIVAVHVKVGSEPHPMEKYHHIKWIILETDCGIYRHMLKCCDTDSKEDATATTTFYISKCEKPLKVYEYCNLHGLFMTEDFEEAKPSDK